MKLADYMKDEIMTSNANLSKENWDLLFNAMNLKEEIAKNKYIDLKIERVSWLGSNKLEDAGITNYYKDERSGNYIYYSLCLSRELTADEKKIWGNAVNIHRNFDIPKKLWFTANRVVIQNRTKKCKCCGQLVK